jgi:hypothetical protein
VPISMANVHNIRKSQVSQITVRFIRLLRRDATVIKSVWRTGTIGSDYVTYDLEQLDALIIEGTKLDQSINQA